MCLTDHVLGFAPASPETSGKSVAAERDVYYGGDPAYWKDEVKTFRAEYEEYKARDTQTPGILATFLAYRADVTREQMKAAGRLQKFERRGERGFSISVDISILTLSLKFCLL